MINARNTASLTGLGFGVGGDISFPGGPLSNTRRGRCWLIHSLLWGLNALVRTRVISLLFEVTTLSTLHVHASFSWGTSRMPEVPLGLASCILNRKTIYSQSGKAIFRRL